MLILLGEPGECPVVEGPRGRDGANGVAGNPGLPVTYRLSTYRKISLYARVCLSKQGFQARHIKRFYGTYHVPAKINYCRQTVPILVTVAAIKLIINQQALRTFVVSFIMSS